MSEIIITYRGDLQHIVPKGERRPCRMVEDLQAFQSCLLPSLDDISDRVYIVCSQENSSSELLLNSALSQMAAQVLLHHLWDTNEREKIQESRKKKGEEIYSSLDPKEAFMFTARAR